MRRMPNPSLDLAVPVLHISGLNNYTLPRPCSIFTQLDRPTWPWRWAVPVLGLDISKDLRAAYAPNVTLTGAGQKVGLLELDGYFPRDIEAYENLAGLSSVTLSNVLLNGFDGSAGVWNSEVALDIEMAIAMAPGLSETIIYEGLFADDVLNRMATDNLAKQLSSSWLWSPSSPTADQVFQQMAAQGQSMFQASGDWDAYFGQPRLLPNPRMIRISRLSAAPL